MSVYKLYAAMTGGTQTDVAQLDIQFEGVITACFGSLYADLDADSEFASAEVSFLSANTFGVNDSRGSIMLLGGQTSLTTSGTPVLAINSGVSDMNIGVSQGERIHMHFSSTSGVSGNVNFYLYVVDGAKVELRRRR